MRLAHYEVVRGSDGKNRKLQIVGTDAFSFAARRDSGGSAPPKMPLPDFFIGAQAEIMGWKIATRDRERFKKYFPNVSLVTP
jgi:predicted nucleic acid-binding protein